MNHLKLDEGAQRQQSQLNKVSVSIFVSILKIAQFGKRQQAGYVI